MSEKKVIGNEKCVFAWVCTKGLQVYLLIRLLISLIPSMPAHKERKLEILLLHFLGRQGCPLILCMLGVEPRFLSEVQSKDRRNGEGASISSYTREALRWRRRQLLSHWHVAHLPEQPGVSHGRRTIESHFWEGSWARVGKTPSSEGSAV